MSNITNLWNQFVQRHIELHPTNSTTLDIPATVADFTSFQDITGFTFPQDLVEIYSINNGEVRNPDSISLFFGLEFLKLESVIKQWQKWKEIWDEEQSGELTDMADYCSSKPKKHIKVLYSNPKWIPIIYDFGGNFIGVDLDPDVDGRVGQIINFGRDEDEKYVLAGNMEEFLQQCLEIAKEPEKVEMLENKHLTDYLKKEIDNRLKSAV